MRTSNRGLKLLMSFEGFRSRAISLGDDRWVVGFGHTKGARDGVVVSKTQAVAILQQYDLPPVEAFIADAVMAPLNQNEFDALVSLVFNIGMDAFRTSDVLAYLNSGEKLAAGEAFTAWRKASLNGRLIIVDALIRRRAAEKALFMRHPGGTPIAPSAHIRPILDEQAARFIPSEPPVVATRERKPAIEPDTIAPQPSDIDEAVVEDDGQTELEFDASAERYVLPDDDRVPVATAHQASPLAEVQKDKAPTGAGVPATKASADKSAPELAAGALVARLTRILGDTEAEDAGPASEKVTAEAGPTPDEITRAISELAEGTDPHADDLPPLPEAILAGEEAMTIEDVAALEQPASTMIDDLEPIPDEALHKPVAMAGANISEPSGTPNRVGLSWLIYALLGLIGALFATFGIVGPNTNSSSLDRGLGQYGYMAMTVLGGLLVLLSVYFLIKAYRSRH
jgi:GH24 family phage-related lysozyme (muramidase)